MHTTGKPIRVLHVDDDAEFGDLVATYLEREDDGIHVDTATSVPEGVDRLATDAVDCVISDYELQDRNGIEFLEAVRADHPDLPFILYTGKGSEEVASDAISAGVTDYLQKERGTSQFAVLANRVRNAVDTYDAQRALTDRERRLNLFFEQSPLGVIEWDENFEFVRLNQAAEEILGYEQSELVGRSWDVVVPESDVEPVDDVVSDLLENAGGYHSINENVRKDGERVVCEWHNRVVTDDDGDVVAVFSQFQDVTERHRREEQLTGLHDVADTIGQCASVQAVCERTIDASENILAFDLSVIDLERDGILRKVAVSEDIPQDDMLDMPVEEGLAGKTYRTGESFLIDDFASHDAADPQGPYRSGISVPMGDHGVFQAVSETTGHFGETDLELAELLVSHATTALDRIERERALETLRERTEFTLESTNSLIWALDLESGETQYHGPVERIFGSDPGQGGTPEQFLERVPHPEDRDDIERAYRRVLERETDEFVLEFRLHPDLGDVSWVRTEAEVWMDGETRWLIGLTVDITERKRREQTMKRQNERLEQFASVVSHDLRNPLQLAQGRLELAREDHDDEHLESAASALDRMQRIIEDVLRLAREGREVDATETVAVQDAVASAWTIVAADTTAELAYAGDLPRIVADRDRLGRLLENLLRNAIEHGDDDVTVTVGELADGFYVADDGPGIPPDDRDEVFTMGYSDHADGTGFGLNIVEQISDAHGWDVRVVEGSDGGARFEITGVALAEE